MTSWWYVWGTTRAAKRETRASRRPSQFLWRRCRGGSSANRERKLQQTLPNRVFQQRVRGSGADLWGHPASLRPDHGQLFRNRIKEGLGKTPREPSGACAATLAEYTPGKPLLHSERRRRHHILPFDEQF